MCGIAGYFSIEGAPIAPCDTLRRMTRVLTHRGPDSDGHYTDGRCALGCRRLAIVDLAHGDQPLYNEDRSLVLVCNGEIFNYPELRDALEARQHQFRTGSDVEVLLHLYEEHGVDLLTRVNGQFAFALYDTRRRLLLAARDAFGVCPLFFTRTSGAWVFGSEIKALLEYPHVPRALDLVGLDELISFPGLVSPRTMFDGISSLPPGHRLVIRDGVVRSDESWDLDFPRMGDVQPATPDAEARYREELEARLARSVKRRLQADVPVGFYLSGGLDSSLVGALMHDAAPDTARHSFSVSFADQQISERPFQEIAAAHVRAEHHDTAFDVDDIVARLERTIRQSEMPLKETYNTCSMALSASARSYGVKVVLSGEGADELMAGYVGYRFDQRGGRGRTRDPVEEALEEEYRIALWGAPDVFYESDWQSLDETKAALYAPALAARRETFDCAHAPLVNKARLVGRHPLHQRSYLDVKLRLSDHLVADHGDRMAMANSVEARFPFLDVDLVDFLRTVPVDLKLRGYRDKYLLRRVAERWLPPAIVQREKFGFHAPGTPALLQARLPWVEDLLSRDRVRRQGCFDPDCVERLKARYAEPGFRLNLPFEQDLLAIVLTCGLLLDVFDLPAVS